MIARCSTRLRHDAVVGRDHEKDHVDAGRTGDHLPHEALVARDVHEPRRRTAT